MTTLTTRTTGDGDAEHDGLLDSLADGVVIADSSGVVTHVNAAARRLLKLSDGVGRRLEEVVTLQDNEGRDWAGCIRPYDGIGIRTAQAEQSWFLADGTELLVT